MYVYIFQLRVTQGMGRFIPLPCNAETVFSRIRERERVSYLLTNIAHHYLIC